MPQSDHPSSAPLAIVGAGPIGLELAAGLQAAGLSNILHFDAGQIGQSFTDWPPETTFFSTPERIAIAGVPIPTTHQGRITGEQYLAYLRAVVEQFDLRVNVHEAVERIERLDDGAFRLHTRHMRTGPHTYHAEKVVLATGGMARPNYLGIPGEDLTHVSHYFPGPHPYFRQRLLIVGGRNSALEAALRCWRIGTDVTISYRRAAFSERVKHLLRQEVSHLIEVGRMGFLPCTQPVEITCEHVVLGPTDGNGNPIEGERTTVEVDHVLLATGFEADMSLFEEAGVDLQGDRREPLFNVETMETNVRGLFVAGTAAGGTQRSQFELFIETAHHHVDKIVRHLTGHTPRIGSVPARSYGYFPEEVDEEQQENPISHR